VLCLACQPYPCDCGFLAPSKSDTAEIEGQDIQYINIKCNYKGDSYETNENDKLLNLCSVITVTCSFTWWKKGIFSTLITIKSLIRKDS
jgi:hypothetical protein